MVRSIDEDLAAGAATGTRRGPSTPQERTAFLAEADHRLSGALHTDRAAELVLEMVVADLADWAQVTLRAGRGFTTRSRLTGRPSRVTALPETAVPADGVLGRVLAQGSAELVPVRDGDGDDPTLASAVPAAEARHDVAGIRPVDVLTVPLRARGSTYGALTLARRSGEGFDADAVAFLSEVAVRVAIALDATRALAESRRVAGVLARDLHPRELPGLAGVRFGSYYRVAVETEALGGDFYDVHGGADDWTAVMGDVCGKGVTAAALTGRVRQSVRTAALVDRSPAFVLDLVNRALIADGEETFVTAVCVRGRRDGDALLLDLATAGHPRPWLVRHDGTLEPVPTAGVVLGLLDDPGYTDLTVRLEAGDTLLLYTDGVPEAPGRRERFGDERLRDVLAATGAADAAVLVEAVAVAVSRHLGDRQHDDIAILAVQAEGPA